MKKQEKWAQEVILNKTKSARPKLSFGFKSKDGFQVLGIRNKFIYFAFLQGLLGGYILSFLPISFIHKIVYIVRHRVYNNPQIKV